MGHRVIHGETGAVGIHIVVDEMAPHVEARRWAIAVGATSYAAEA